VIAHAIANIAAKLAVQFDKPVGLGITGPGMTDEQAAERIDNARNAVEAVVRVANVLKDLGE
jgi:6,7-dimethyl-8-ribityllumazine synthase